MPDPLNVIVDLSHHNGNVDLALAKAASIATVIHEVTQGRAAAYPMYHANRAKAQDAVLIISTGGAGHDTAER
jgi:lysozyme